LSGDRPQLTANKRLGLALAVAVDGAGEQLLADAGFALDQHRKPDEAAFCAVRSTPAMVSLR